MAKRRNRKRSGGIAREDYTNGGRVGYQRGRVVVDRETGEVIEGFLNNQGRKTTSFSKKQSKNG